MSRLAALTFSVAEVTPKTRWIFLEALTEDGRRGAGEATLGGQEAAVGEAVRALAAQAFALPEADPGHLARPALPGLAQAAAFSALDQAFWDLTAQAGGVRLADALAAGTGARRGAIPLYANINRRTLDRSPEGFAASARDALAAGHAAIKIAPFDEATPEARRGGALTDAIGPGLARVAAVREAIGPARTLQVDCHWRLDEDAAARVIAGAAECGVRWVECPLPETPEQMAALVRLRGLANRRGVLLAGCEQGIGLAGFLPFLDAGAYDVMMPDAKYVGGLAEMLRLAARMRLSGVAFSPHNPSGPVCHAVSLQLCAAVDELHSLETQFDETPLFAALAGSPFAPVQAGRESLPDAPGLGFALDPATLDRCRTTHWTLTRNGETARP